MQLHHEIITGNPQRITVFLHGLMGRGKNFLQIATALQDTTTSILVDQPNHGESFWTETFSYEQMADAVAQLLQTSALVNTAGGKVHLVGHSMGGKTAMMFALKYPELLHTLTVVDISPVPSPTIAPFDHLLGTLRTIVPGALSGRVQADAQIKEAIPDQTMRSFLLGNLVRSNKGLGFAWQPNLELLYQSLSQIVDFNPPQGSQFPSPTLWLGGANSNYIKEADLPVMAALFPDVIPVTVPAAGHWVHADQPAEFVRLIAEFISSEAS